MTMPHKRLFEVPTDVYPFQDHWIEVDGLTLHYIDQGEGPVLLLFHGNPSWSLLYRGIIPELSKNYRCICVDYPGYGFSERPPLEEYDYLPETHSALMEKVVDALDLQEIPSFHQDWGGPIGLGLAGRRPELFKKLVIGNTWAFNINEDARFEGAKKFSLWMGGENNRSNVIEKNIFLKAVTPLLRRGQDRRDPALGDQVAAAYNAPWSKPEWRYPTWISPNQISEGVSFINEVEKGLVNLKDKPVLFFWGMKDSVCVPALYQKFKEYFPNNRLVEFPEAEHFFQEDEPEQIVAEMQVFLKP